MTKKLCLLLAAILCMVSIFSAAPAFGSGWDDYNGPIYHAPTKQPAGELPTEEPVIDDPAPEPTELPAAEVPTEEPAPAENPSGKTIAEGLHDSPDEPAVITETPEALPTPVIPDPFVNSNSGQKTRKDVTLTLNEVNIYGETGANVQKILDYLKGMTLKTMSQTSPASRNQVSFSLADKDIFSLDIQNGNPYYIKSNFLGKNFIMVFSEDEFEEKLVNAIYDLVEKVSGDTSNLPDREQVLSTIRMIREGGMGVQQNLPSLSFDKQLDTSAFMGILMDVMSRFVPAEPAEGITYRYAELDPETLKFEWPSADELPQPGQPASAVTAMFFGEDLADLIDVLPEFFAANPEFTDTVNQTIIQVMQRFDPSNAVPEGTDMLGMFVESMKESVKDAVDFYLNLRIDSDRNGSPAMITIEIGKPENGVNSGIILSILIGNNYPASAYEVSADAFQSDMTIPLFRFLSTTNHGNYDTFSINFRLTDPNNPDGMEFALFSEKEGSAFGNGQPENTTVRFDIGGGQEGYMKITTLPTANNFGSYDKVTQINYDQSVYGQKLFSVSLLSEVTIGEALPALTPADAVAASEMSASDYADCAGNIFLELMGLMVMFM